MAIPNMTARQKQRRMIIVQHRDRQRTNSTTGPSHKAATKSRKAKRDGQREYTTNGKGCGESFARRKSSKAQVSDLIILGRSSRHFFLPRMKHQSIYACLLEERQYADANSFQRPSIQLQRWLGEDPTMAPWSPMLIHNQN